MILLFLFLEKNFIIIDLNFKIHYNFGMQNLLYCLGAAFFFVLENISADIYINQSQQSISVQER